MPLTTKWPPRRHWYLSDVVRPVAMCGAQRVRDSFRAGLSRPPPAGAPGGAKSEGVGGKATGGEKRLAEASPQVTPEKATRSGSVPALAEKARKLKAARGSMF